MDAIDTVRRYLELAEGFVSDRESLEEVLHPDITITEFPNALSPRLRTRRFPEIQEGLAGGRSILKWQRFEIVDTLRSGERLTVEVRWNGEMAIDAGPLRKDQLLAAHICYIFEFRDGRIIHHRNYDCYEAF